MSKEKAVVIVSGGMDSITLANILHSTFELHLVSFDYGQRHVKELMYAQYWADYLKASWHTIPLPKEYMRLLRQSDSVLINPNVDVPEGHYAQENMKKTVVPNRNATMLTLASSIAIAEGATKVFTAVHAGDHFIYPDCRPEFIKAMSTAIRLANLGFADEKFSIEAPFVFMSKADIARQGALLDPPVDHRFTWSCYKGGEIHCGRCGTCVERREAFHLANLSDPTEYEDKDFWKAVTDV